MTTEPIHEWFELTYASYLVLPRSILQSAPVHWQNKMVLLLKELGERFGSVPREGHYRVSLRGSHGRFIEDELRDYERGRRRIKALPRRKGAGK